MRQIFFVWFNQSKNSIKYNEQKTNEIELKRLMKCFVIWINTMKLKKYLFNIYINASKYYIHKLMFKGLKSFKENRYYKQLQREQFMNADILNEQRLIKNAMNTILFQCDCIQKANIFYYKCKLKIRNNYLIFQFGMKNLMKLKLKQINLKLV